MEICNSYLGGFTYILRANNGQLLYESRDYKSYATCEDAANAFIEAVKVGMFTVRADKFKRYKFILKSPTSNNIIYVGESFDNERSCQSNIDSVRRFAVDCVFVDSTTADFVADFKPYVISEQRQGQGRQSQRRRRQVGDRTDGRKQQESPLRFPLVRQQQSAPLREPRLQELRQLQGRSRDLPQGGHRRRIHHRSGQVGQIQIHTA